MKSSYKLIHLTISHYTGSQIYCIAVWKISGAIARVCHFVNLSSVISSHQQCHYSHLFRTQNELLTWFVYRSVCRFLSHEYVMMYPSDVFDDLPKKRRALTSTWKRDRDRERVRQVGKEKQNRARKCQDNFCPLPSTVFTTRIVMQSIRYICNPRLWQILKKHEHL